MKKCVLALLLATRAVRADDDGEPKFSLPSEGDRAAWQLPGFRLGLGITYGTLGGTYGAPSGQLKGVQLRTAMRLDQDWSAALTFDYAIASSTGGLSGLRFAGTLEPTWHVTRSVSLAAGVGFGGIVEGRTDRIDPEPLGDSIETSYTFPDASAPIASWGGVGPAARLRAEWTFVIGPRTAANVGIEATGQWTGCVSETDRVEPDTGEAIVRRQWWGHLGGALAVGVTWR